MTEDKLQGIYFAIADFGLCLFDSATLTKQDTKETLQGPKTSTTSLM